MPRDPLAALARLRRLESEAARRRLAEAIALAEDSAARLATAEHALHEQPLADARDYAAWLPAGLAARAAATRAAGRAEAEATTARAEVAEAAAAERALAEWRAARADAVRRQQLRAHAVALDDVLPRQPGPRPGPDDL